MHLTDSVAVGAAGSSLPIHLLPAQLTLADSVPHTALDGISALRDGLALEAGLALVYRELLQVSVALGHSQTLSYTAIARVVDALLLSEAVGSVLEAHAVIAEALTLGAMASGTPVSSLADSVTLTTTAASHYTAIAQLIDALALQAAQTHTATLAIALKDGITFGATQNTSLDAIAALRDRLEFVLQVAIDNEQYVAWSMNAASKGATRYTNYPFNSFMRIGGRYYGVSDTGRYRLDGDNDAGSPIAAKLRLGMSSLGTRLLKRMASAYLGFTASGDLRLKVIVANEVTGAREAHVYRLYARGAQSMRESRVQIGKGLKSVYWDFQIENVAGGDFEIDVVEILPLMLERRIRGNAGGKA
ncbi:MAG: hypothetical protein HOQ02_02485 [Lysobacter sp.]|nr:hypothetical protein [Lysobacter sp.]